MLLAKFSNNVVSRQYSALILGGWGEECDGAGDDGSGGTCGCLGSDTRNSCSNGKAQCTGRGGLTYTQDCNGASC